jgi:hypothetical protein
MTSSFSKAHMTYAESWTMTGNLWTSNYIFLDTSRYLAEYLWPSRQNNTIHSQS